MSNRCLYYSTKCIGLQWRFDSAAENAGMKRSFCKGGGCGEESAASDAGADLRFWTNEAGLQENPVGFFSFFRCFVTVAQYGWP